MEESNSSRDAKTQESAKGKICKEETKKSSIMKRLWSKTGLDLGTSLLILKAAVPQTVAIAMYQARNISDTYSTLGYLVAISALLGLAISPRAKFLQTMLANILTICLGASVALLAIWSAIQARNHTTPSGTSPEGYNSSASAVCAIWLFFQVYLVNALRSARPQLQFSGILYSIFAIVSMAYAPQFPTMSVGIDFVKRLLEAFLTGFALATGVSLFLMPITQRKVVFKEITGYLQSLRGVMKAQISYTSSLEHIQTVRDSDENASDSSKLNKQGPVRHIISDTPEAVALKASTGALKSLHGKLAADLTFAKREMAYGKLRSQDLSELFKLLRNIFIPLLGMSSLIDIVDRVAHMEHWDAPDRQSQENEPKTVEEWQGIMKVLREPLAGIGDAIDIALEHVLLRLELVKPSKKTGKSVDEESNAAAPRPNTDEFLAWFGRQTEDFYSSRKVTLRHWCEQKGIALPKDSFETKINFSENFDSFNLSSASRNQRQLFAVLYIEYLLYSTSRATLDLVSFADSKASDGTLKSNRIIMPSYRQVTKYISGSFSIADDANTNSYNVSIDGDQDVYLGEAFRDRKDPEHLPPRNAWERLGNSIRKLSHLLRSPHSVFGFRVACATLSIGIVAYLRDTYVFFIQQRLVWSLIMVAISMTRTSGQSLFNFILRIFGTLCAMIASYLIYYIPDGHTAGIIVFLFIWEVMCFYVVVKIPRFVIVGIISAVTTILIIGYELQVRAIGVVASESNGQPAYDINVLAPYRLACVAGGLVVAWFWTIFPFPITDHSELRKDVGASIYLLANLYAIVHETVRARIRGDMGDLKQKGSPGANLEKAKQKVFSKELLLIDRLKMSSGFSRWEVALGGRFPREAYDALIKCTESVLNFAALISYASQTFSSDEESSTEWQQDFQHLLKQLGATSHDITSRLCLLSSSMSNGTPLPPYLKEMEPYAFTEKLRAIDTDILSVRHIAEPGYAAFAVIQISGRLIVGDLNRLTDLVRELVGELDFSFHVVSTSPQNATVSSTEDSSAKGKLA